MVTRNTCDIAAIPALKELMWRCGGKRGGLKASPPSPRFRRSRMARAARTRSSHRKRPARLVVKTDVISIRSRMQSKRVIRRFLPFVPGGGVTGDSRVRRWRRRDRGVRRVSVRGRGEFKDEDLAVGVEGAAGGGARFAHGVFGKKESVLGDEAGSDEGFLNVVAFEVDIGIDFVGDAVVALVALEANVMGGGADPEGLAIDGERRLPDAQVIA